VYLCLEDTAARFSESFVYIPDWERLTMKPHFETTSVDLGQKGLI